MRDFLLCDENYVLYAARSYKKPVCLSTDEFIKDISSVERLKSDLTRYKSDKEPRQLRIIINKIVTFSNLFGVIPACKLIFWKLRKDEWHINFLMTILIFLRILGKESLIISKDLVLYPENYGINDEIFKELENVFNNRK